MNAPELRPILGFPGYGVAEDKSVWSHRAGEWRQLPMDPVRKQVFLWRDGRSKHASVRRLWEECWGPRAMTKLDRGRVVGEAHGRARLNDAKVLEARRLYAEGWTERRLATHFGVRPGTMHYALVGKTWQHLPVLPLQDASAPGEK